MYKVIFFDMDGTLLNSNKEVSITTIETLLKIRKKRNRDCFNIREM